VFTVQVTLCTCEYFGTLPKCLGYIQVSSNSQVIKYCLMSLFLVGVHNLEPLNDWSWACFAGIVFGIQHHYVMQPAAIISHVNLNFILCPATKDPFRGPYYRTWAVFHQTFCLLILGKLYTIVVKWLLPKSKKA